MRGLYLVALVISIVGLGTLDYKYKLAFFTDAKRTLKVVGVSVGIFMVWDVLGILLKIFFIGVNPYLLGLRIGQFPLEELFFLILLTYCSLVTYRLFGRSTSR